MKFLNRTKNNRELEAKAAAKDRKLQRRNARRGKAVLTFGILEELARTCTVNR